MINPLGAPPISESSLVEEYDTSEQVTVDGTQRARLIQAVLEPLQAAKWMGATEVALEGEMLAGFKESLNSGAISDEEVFAVIGRHVKTNFNPEDTSSHTPAELAVALNSLREPRENTRIAKLVALVTDDAFFGGGAMNHELFKSAPVVDGNSVANLTTKYKHPWELEAKLEEVLVVLFENNGVRKFNEYDYVRRVLLGTVYGKQFDYYEQYLLLKEETDKSYGVGFDSLSPYEQARLTAKKN